MPKNKKDDVFIKACIEVDEDTWEKSHILKTKDRITLNAFYAKAIKAYVADRIKLFVI